MARGPGEPVPANVLEEMERNPGEPWKVRDRMLTEMCWCPKGIPWGEWKAERLNQLFLEQGSAGELGCITAKTARHGEGSATRVRAKPDSQR